MNLLSKKALKDCKFACWELANAEEKNDIQIIKLRWFTCLALLRSIGHIIDKADKENNKKYKHIFEDYHRKKKNDDIFKNFIEKERNLILKEYIDYIKEEKKEVVESFTLVDEEGNCIVDENGNRLVSEPCNLVTKYFNKSDGFAKGKLLHQIVEMGIEWWENYIKELEEKVKNE